MGNLTVKEIESKAKGEPGRYADGAGLYFVVPKLGVPYWMRRYTAQSKRKEMTLAKYSDMSLADWHRGNINRLKYANIPEPIYRKDIAPHIGSFNIDTVTFYIRCWWRRKK